MIQYERLVCSLYTEVSYVRMWYGLPACQWKVAAEDSQKSYLVLSWHIARGSYSEDQLQLQFLYDGYLENCQSIYSLMCMWDGGYSVTTKGIVFSVRPEAQQDRKGADGSFPFLNHLILIFGVSVGLL